MSSSRQAQKERYWNLKRAGLCTACGVNTATRFARCGDCRQRCKEAKPTKRMTPSACFVGGLCAVSLKEALPALGLQIDYFPDRYEVSGADVFSYPRRDDSTPYDALRFRGHLEPESFTRKVRAWRKSKKQSELAECV